MNNETQSILMPEWMFVVNGKREECTLHHYSQIIY